MPNLIKTTFDCHIVNNELSLVKSGNPYQRESLSRVDLLALIKLEQSILNQKYYLPLFVNRRIMRYLWLNQGTPTEGDISVLLTSLY
jgi:hypothetical protein